VEHHPSGTTCFGENLAGTKDEELAKVNPLKTLKTMVHSAGQEERMGPPTGLQ